MGAPAAFTKHASQRRYVFAGKNKSAASTRDELQIFHILSFVFSQTQTRTGTSSFEEQQNLSADQAPLKPADCRKWSLSLLCSYLELRGNRQRWQLEATAAISSLTAMPDKKWWEKHSRISRSWQSIIRVHDLIPHADKLSKQNWLGLKRKENINFKTLSSEICFLAVFNTFSWQEN